MYNSGLEIPKVAFSLLDYTEIEPGSYFIGFDLDNSGKLSKMDHLGQITVIEGAGGGGGTVVGVTDDGNGVVTVDNTNPTSPIVKFNGIETDGLTITGDGTSGNPLSAVATQTLVDILHADLVSLVNSNNLTPGVYYRITDFQTIYDQEVTNNLKTAPIEPLCVLALTDSELSLDAYQEDYPRDTIKYQLEYTTRVTLTPTKGRITERIDEWNNHTDYDHRNVLFKRWQDPLTGAFTIIADNGHQSFEFPSFNNTFTVQNGWVSATGVKDIGTYARYVTGGYPHEFSNIVLLPDTNGYFESIEFNYCYGLSLFSSNECVFNKCEGGSIALWTRNCLFEQLRGFNFLGDTNDVMIRESELFGDNMSSSPTIIEVSIEKIMNSKIYLGGDRASFKLSAQDSILRVGEIGAYDPLSWPTSRISLSQSEAAINSNTDSPINISMIDSKLKYLEADTCLINNVTFNNVFIYNLSNLTLKSNSVIKNLRVHVDQFEGDYSLSTLLYDDTLVKEVVSSNNILNGNYMLKYTDSYGSTVLSQLTD